MDLEKLSAANAPGLTWLLTRLRSRLDPGRSLSVTVANNTSPDGFASDGYELGALGRIADRVILMAYDQHGPWEPTPGPIGALDWQRRGLSVLLGAVAGIQGRPRRSRLWLLVAAAPGVDGAGRR